MSESDFHRPLPPMLCLTGVDGCGKSTQLERIAERLLRSRSKRARVLTVWSISGTPRYQNHPFISDRDAIHRYLSTLHGGARMLFIAHALVEALDLIADEGADVILADGYWYKYLCSERVHGLPLEWLLTTVASLPRPGRTVLLDLDPRQSWARKPSVTPYECGMARPSEQSFVAFQDRLRAELAALARREKWAVIPCDRPEEEVADAVWEHIRQEV